ncbi:MAG TPA: hypothetical protein P5281_00890 [Anaerovoracaceae bacterium]|nr:hypothetical protein [Eubacteriales bacterium]HPF19101.1 hypothetical protein [Bacillota bacterium]HRV32873.1 hypothetical protein [Anaerovoracaceae bacterium]
MEDVIKEISRIDRQAFAQEEDNKAILSKQKEACEDEMKAYREAQLQNARIRSRQLKEQQISDAMEKTSEQKANLQEEVEQLKTHFQKIEKKVVQDIFDKLFSMESRE